MDAIRVLVAILLIIAIGAAASVFQDPDLLPPGKRTLGRFLLFVVLGTIGCIVLFALMAFFVESGI